LEVYNSLGQKVKTIINEHLKKGNHKISFKADNLPAGTYFYKLKIMNKVLIRKMIYLK